MLKKITLPKSLVIEIDKIGEQFGFKSETEFVKEAVSEKILQLKKRIFSSISSEVRRGLEKKGITHDEILKDFEKHGNYYSSRC